MQVPVLTTERLTLRHFAESDLKAYASIVSDTEVVQFLEAGKQLSRADAWRQITMIPGHWTLRSFGLLAVEERATRRLLTRIGCYQPRDTRVESTGRDARALRHNTRCAVGSLASDAQ